MESGKKSKSILLTGVLTAVGASLCCITPVLALLAGSSSAAATFSWMEPFRPYLGALTIGVLGFAWYQKIKPQKVELTADDCNCEVEPGKKPFMQSKGFLAGVTIFALLMLAFPNYAHIFYPESQANTIITPESSIRKVHFDIEGMTCQGCAEHIQFAANEEEGVINSEASYENGEATIEYDEKLVKVDEIIEAINATGYKVTDQKTLKP
jgi:mercuric ion transport protein